MSEVFESGKHHSLSAWGASWQNLYSESVFMLSFLHEARNN